MPGKPIEAQLYADIEAAGGWESIWDRVANGETQTAIAESLGISQGFLSRVIHLDQARVQAFRKREPERRTTGRARSRLPAHHRDLRAAGDLRGGSCWEAVKTVNR